MNQMHLEADAQLSQERKSLSLISKAIDKHSDRGPGFTLAGVSVTLASMWLGKAKGALGIRSPYPESFNPQSKTIEPKADVSPDELEIPEGLDEVGRIKFLRSELNKMENSIVNDTKIMVDHRAYQFAVSNALLHCCEATMWLGQSLDEIRRKDQGEDKPEGEVKKLKTVVPTEFPEIKETGEAPVPSDFVNQEMGRIASMPPTVDESQPPAPTAGPGENNTNVSGDQPVETNINPDAFVSSKAGKPEEEEKAKEAEKAGKGEKKKGSSGKTK